MYQQTLLSNDSAIGNPGPLPAVIATWTDPVMLADLTGRVDPQFGFDGTGFWPVVVSTPAFDATMRTLVGTVTLGAADTAAHTWTATADVRDLTAAEIAAANPVPPSVTNYQARAVLIGQGFIAKVDAAIRGADQTVTANAVALAAWDYANSFYRSDPLIAAMQATLGLSDGQVDDMFRAAAKVAS